MICPNCQNENDAANSFCQNCGAALPAQFVVPPTQVLKTPLPQNDDYLSSPTVISGRKANFNQQPANFNQSALNSNQPGLNASTPFGAPAAPARAKSHTGLLVAAGVFVLFLLSGAVAGALFLLNRTNASPAENANLVRDANVPSTPDNSNSDIEKPKTKATLKPTAAPPDGAKNAFAKTNLVLRSEPSLAGQKIATLRRGQKIFVIGYSENTDYWNGLEGKWANVQTESGQRGWVFSPLINY